MDGQTVFDFGRGAKSDKLHFRRFKFKDTMHAKFNVEKNQCDLELVSVF